MVTVDKIKKEYKQTEAGIIPNDWSVKTLNDLFDITSSKRVFQSEWTSYGVPFYRARELAVLSEQGRVHNELFISEEMYREYSSRYGVPKAGDILITGVGTLGKVYVVNDGRKFYFKDGNIIWLKNKGGTDSRFIEQLYKTPLIVTQITNLSGGSTVGTYTITNAKKTIVPFPALPEQTVIAEVLCDTDSLIGNLERLISKKKLIKQGTMQKLLSGSKRLPGFKGQWEKKKLGELLAYEQPTKYLVRSTEYNDSYDTPVLTAGKTFILGYTNETSGIFKDVPVIIFDDFTTANKYVTFPFKAKSSAMKMLRPRSKETNLRFVFEKMQLTDFKLGDHKRYWISEYQNIELDMPKPDEQDAIATVLADMDEEISELETRLEKTRELRRGMMQKLLTGSIRLV